MGRNLHVVQRDRGWAVKGEGESWDRSQHQTQAEAIAAARIQAQVTAAEVVIHGRDGLIRDKDSYGNDPVPPKDQRH